MILQNKRDNLFVILAGFFITNAVVAELISSKLISIGPFTTIVGILPWPFVFLLTDTVNEFYGKKAVRRLSILTSILIGYAFLILSLAIAVPASSFSIVTQLEFEKVFAQSQWVIVGSITAFLIAQILDVYIFWWIRKFTGKRAIWLRATGSTMISQLFDTFIVLAIGFLLPGKISFDQFVSLGFTNYLFKIIIAIALTPFIYTVHNFAGKYLGADSEKLSEESANESI